MSDFFYDGQMRRYLTQFIRVMSNFSYKDSKGQLVQVPARYGDMTRQVSQIINKNSENVMPSAPFIACYIKNIQFDRARVQDPTFVDVKNIRERAYNQDTNKYEYTQGGGYTVERIMPTPYTVSFIADIWTSNTEQKLQLWEQIAVLFNPSMELQTTNNYLDWTSLTALELTDMVWSSRSIPQGIEQDIDILTMNFTAPIWITPPAKVKKLGIITKIISTIYAVPTGSIAEEGADVIGGDAAKSRLVITSENYSLLVVNNSAYLIKNRNVENDSDLLNIEKKYSWNLLLDLHPGVFKAGLSQIRLQKPEGGEIVCYLTLDPLDDLRMMLNIDRDTVPENTIINGRGTIDAIINPETFNPHEVSGHVLPSLTNGITYLILEDINPAYGTEGFEGVQAWKNRDGSDFHAHTNDIILWDGEQWNVIFDATSTTDVTYITNIYTGVQYKWKDGSWTKSYEGVYSNELWRLIL
jgi:hypothetical protein